jgi:predicted MFS family arabinose efflux permease
MEKNNLDRPSVVSAAAGSGTAAILVFATMPVLVGGMADLYQLSDLQSGLIATLYFSTYAITALTSPLWIRRISWRLLSGCGFSLMLVSIFAALNASSYDAARVAIAASGLGAGLLYPVSMSLVSDMVHTERVYAIKLAIEQLVPAALLILLAMGTLAASGLSGTLTAILVTLVICILASYAMPRRGAHTATDGQSDWGRLSLGLLALLALAINFSGFAGLWVFIERIAVERNFQPDFINTWIAVGLISSGVGPLLAAVVADRVGRTAPVLLSTAAALASMALLSGEVTSTHYALALILLPLTYYFGISYLFSIVVATDTSGRISGLMSFALAVGSAVGPALFGALRNSGGPVLTLMAACMASGAIIFILIHLRMAATTGASLDD